MGKAAGQKQAVDEFYMSIHMGICWGPLDAITGLYVGEKIAWEGEATAEGGIYVNSPSLFGGVKEQGGVGGNMYYLPGGRGQVMPAALAQRLGLTPNTCPAYRGVASVFFVGTDGVAAGSLDLSSTTGGTTGGGGSTGGTGPTYPVGGDGSGGGTTGGGGGAYCVWADATMPDGKPAREVERGDWLRSLDYGTMETTRQSQVQDARLAHNVPCVTIVTVSGIEKTVSRSTPVTMRDGSQVPVNYCCGREVPVQDESGFRWEAVRDLRDAGRRDVMLIDASGATFAAGDVAGRYVFTHNKLAEPINN